MPPSRVDTLKSDLVFPPCTLTLLHRQYSQFFLTTCCHSSLALSPPLSLTRCVDSKWVNESRTEGGENEAGRQTGRAFSEVKQRE